MVAFGIVVKKEARDFLEKTNTRLQSENVVKNPFRGKVVDISKPGDKECTYIVIMKPIYPKLYYVGFIMLATTLFFTGIRISWWLIPGVLLSSIYVFWSRYFYYLMLKIGLKKSGIRSNTTLRGLNFCLEQIFI